jgi:hypothetical protein
MSLFSRLFNKPAPTPVPAPESPPRLSPPEEETARRAADEESALRAALDAGDADALSRLVLEGSTTGVRQRAAQAIERPEQVTELIRRVRGGKDKSVYRILTTKRDASLAARAEAERRDAECEAAVEALERHSRRPHDALFAPALEQFEKRWQAIETQATAERRARAGEALERAYAVLREHRERLETQTARAQALAAAAAAAQAEHERKRAAAAAAETEEQERLEAERRARSEETAALDLTLRTLGRLLRSAQAALEQGNTARAARLRAEFETARPATLSLPPRLASPLQKLDERLRELEDWRTFSAAPKREELLREIASLVDARLEPPVLARQIRDLRLQWRTLHRGVGEEFAAERQRFSELAERAFEPCRQYFAAQAELRAENLRRREHLLERVRAFTARQDSGDPDWRLTLQVLAEARREWRQYGPVERAAATSSQTAFDAAIGELQRRLNEEFARNVAAKLELIERAARLGELADTRQAIEGMKDLQRLWKNVGLVPREQSEALWERFREHCDAVFARREQESAAYLAGLEANRAKATALCEDVERIATLSGADLRAGAAQFDDLRRGVEDLELPRGGARELRLRFERGLERALEAVSAEQKRAAVRVWSDVFEVANRVRAFALGRVQDLDPETLGALRQQADASLASVNSWPKGARSILEGALERATAGEVERDLAVNERALRLLCVRAELLVNLPSPTEDQALRREHQLQRLVSSMGTGAGHDPAQLEALLLEWIAVGPTAEPTYAALLRRIERCREALPGRGRYLSPT